MEMVASWVVDNAQDISVTSAAIIIAIAIYRETIVPGWKFRRLQAKCDALESEARASDDQLTRLTGAVERLERSLDRPQSEQRSADRRRRASDA